MFYRLNIMIYGLIKFITKNFKRRNRLKIHVSLKKQNKQKFFVNNSIRYNMNKLTKTQDLYERSSESAFNEDKFFRFTSF